MGAVDTLVVQTLEKFLTATLARMDMTPETAKAKVLEISNTVLSFKAQADRIEANQRLIMAALKIEPLEQREVANVTKEISAGETGGNANSE